MFDSKQTLTHRLADATDLLIDFATLGEYGLEPVDTAAQPCQGARTRPLPITDRESFSEVLFPNRHRGDRKQPFSKRPRTDRSLRGDRITTASSSPSDCGSGQRLARKRGVRGASDPARAKGAA